MDKISFISKLFLENNLLPNETGQGILVIVGIVIGIIAAIALFIFTFKNIFVSRVFSLIFTIISLITIIGYIQGSEDLLFFAIPASALALMYYGGPACFEDTRDTEVYLILGTLVEDTVGDSPVATFFSVLGGSLILSAIFVLLVSNLGIIVMVVLHAIFAILIIISFIRAILDLF